MKLWYVASALLASCVMIWAASEEATMQDLQQESKQQQQQQSGLRLISFDAVGKHIAMGLDYLLPFLEVPVKRKRNAPPKPLIVVNSAAMLSGGLIAVAGMAVAHLMRSIGLESFEETSSTDEAQERALYDDEQRFMQLFDNFKLVYRNDSGVRVETPLPSLLQTIERSFLQNDINLPVCLLKSICAAVHEASNNVYSGQATDAERVLDGATSWSWLLNWLQQSALREAIEAGKVATPQYCAAKYARCKWAAPAQQLKQLLRNNVKFK